MNIEDFLAKTKTVAVANGRSLAYLDLGDKNGRPVFFFHGLPGSRVEAIPLHDSAKQHSFRLIAPDRPGMGRSDPQLERSLLDWPRDVTALADKLGLDRFGVIGISGGGPFALACAYAIPERLEFVVDVAGSAPVWTDPAYRSQLSSVDRLFSTLGSYLPTAFMRLPFAYLAFRIRRMTDDSEMLQLFGDAYSEPDRQMILNRKNGRLFIRDVQESFHQGIQAIAEETMLNYKPWGFALNQIKMPVHLFHGTEDNLVPFSFAEYKANQLPKAIFNPLPGQGHLSLLLNPAELFRYLQSLPAG